MEGGQQNSNCHKRTENNRILFPGENLLIFDVCETAATDNVQLSQCDEI